MTYIGIVLIVVIILAAVIYTSIRNKEINEKGIVTNAEVTRVAEKDSIDNNGSLMDTTYVFYVTYYTQDGQAVEAQLASGKSIETRIGKSWDSDLHIGSHVQIKYLPEKPNYVIYVD